MIFYPGCPGTGAWDKGENGRKMKTYYRLHKAPDQVRLIQTPKQQLFVYKNLQNEPIHPTC